MESPKNDFSQDPYAYSPKNNPFRKSTYNTKSSASSFGESPATPNMKKSRVRDNNRNQQQPNQIVEEDAQQTFPNDEMNEIEQGASNLVISTTFTPKGNFLLFDA